MTRYVQELIPTVYMFIDHCSPTAPLPRVEFHRMDSPFYPGVKWAVRKHGSCLDKNGEWEYEPMPSSRTDEFYARCRFESLQDAVNAYNKNMSEEERNP